MCQFEHGCNQIKLLETQDWPAQADIHFGFTANSTLSTSHCYCSLSISH